MKNIFWFTLIALIIYGLNIFDDMEQFQQIIKYFVSSIQSAQGFALPPFWLDNRMLIWGVVIVVLLLYYRSVWASYQLLVSNYKSTAMIAQKPSLSLQQTNYLYLQNKVSSVVVWLIQLCEAGVLTLHYQEGIKPWSISINRTKLASSEFDQQLLNDLFVSRDKLIIEDSFSDPNPVFRELSDHLYKKIESDCEFLVQKKTSSFPVWLVLACMFIEIPFVSALYTEVPGVIFIVLFLVIITGVVVAYFFIPQLQSFFSGHFAMVLLVSIIPLLVLAIPHWGLLGMGNSNYYFFIPFYPEIVVTIAVLVRFSPLLPKDQYLLPHIIAYKNHLQQSETKICESDIPWTLGLQVHSGVFDKKWTYHEDQLPNWLDSKEQDVQKVMHNLRISFESSVSTATYGEHKRKRMRSSRRSSHRF